jgi:hypothetical protein
MRWTTISTVSIIDPGEAFGRRERRARGGSIQCFHGISKPVRGYGEEEIFTTLRTAMSVEFNKYKRGLVKNVHK